MGEHMLAFVGSYTGAGSSEGIYTYRFDSASGRLERLSAEGGLENPSYVALHPSGNRLYAVSEVGTFAGSPSGGVGAFAVDAETGEMTLLNLKPTGGTGPCYVSVAGGGEWVLVANYSGGSVSLLPVLSDGSLGDRSDMVQHEGASLDSKRQAGPHAHSIVPDASGNFAFVPDLGLDRILTYRVEREAGRLVPHEIPFTQVRAGAGPRHLAFHPGGRFAYVINELDSTLTSFAYDAGAATLAEIETVPALPEGYDGASHCADVHVLPSGRYIYGSNRGHDSIVTYRVDSETGLLGHVAHTSSGGRTPRGFAIDPSGRFLVAANQNSDSLVTFRIDADTGLLEDTGHRAEVHRPVCVKFHPLA